jgi:hypothetical protein
MPDTSGKPPKNPLEIRKKVLADPNTAQIAQKLGVPLEEYVEGVVHFAMNPDELPEYVVVTDEVLKEKFGLEAPPKTDEIIAIFNKEVEYATVSDKTDFTAAKAKPVELSDGPSAQAPGGDAKLQEDLKKQLLGKKGGKA